MGEIDLRRAGRVLRVRDGGAPDGRVVMYFHGTPSSRLDLTFGEQWAREHGVRLVCFDRPGYGGSTPAPFSLHSVALDAQAVADQLGCDRFATLGQSGGGPFALASAAVLGDRVPRVGVASAPGPFGLVPGSLDQLDENDRTAYAMLPHDDLDAVARAFATGFEPLISTFELAPAQIVAAFADHMSRTDQRLLADERLAAAFSASMRESLRQGAMGAGWDNVSWVGPWDVDVTTLACPVLLWYGAEDRFVPLAHGRWLRDHLPHAHLIEATGEGHLGIFEHLEDRLLALTAP